MIAGCPLTSPILPPNPPSLRPTSTRAPAPACPATTASGPSPAAAPAEVEGGSALGEERMRAYEPRTATEVANRTADRAAELAEEAR